MELFIDTLKQECTDTNNYLIVDDDYINGNEFAVTSRRNLSPPNEDRRDRDRDREKDRDRERERDRDRRRDRSRSHERKRTTSPNRNSYHHRRSRSPLDRNSSRRGRDSSRDRHRNSSAPNKGSSTSSLRTTTASSSSSKSYNSGSSQSDKEMGLKYRWEKTVYVSNIPYDIRWTDLKDLFRVKVGDIVYCEVFEKDGKSLGVGTIEFKLVTDAKRAVEIMHQYELGGRRIGVRMDNEGYKTRMAKEMANDKGSNSNNSINNDHNNSSSSKLKSSSSSTSSRDHRDHHSSSSSKDQKNSNTNQAASVNNDQAAIIALATALLGSATNTSPNNSSVATSALLGSLLGLNAPVNPLLSQAFGINTNGSNNGTNNTYGKTTNTNALAYGGSNPTPAQMTLLNQLAAELKVEGPVTNRLFVASLDYKVDEAKIQEVFALAGTVTNVSLFRDRDNKSRGMAVVEYDTPFEALNAVSMFNKQQLLDRQMTVRFDTKPPELADLPDIKATIMAPPKLPSGLKSIGSGLNLGSLSNSNITSYGNGLISAPTDFSNNGYGYGGSNGGTSLLGNGANSLINNNNSSSSNKNGYSNGSSKNNSSNNNGGGDIRIVSSGSNGSLSISNRIGGFSNNNSSNSNSYSSSQNHHHDLSSSKNNSSSSYSNYNTSNTSRTTTSTNSNNNFSSKNYTAKTKIFIKNIPFSWDDRRLKEKFRQSGQIEEAEIRLRDGKSKGYGTIRFAYPDQAAKAVELFNNARFEGRTLEVKIDDY